MELGPRTCWWRGVRLVAMEVWRVVVRDVRLMSIMCHVDDVCTLTDLGQAGASPSYLPTTPNGPFRRCVV